MLFERRYLRTKGGQCHYTHWSTSSNLHHRPPRAGNPPPPSPPLRQFTFLPSPLSDYSRKSKVFSQDAELGSFKSFRRWHLGQTIGIKPPAHQSGTRLQTAAYRDSDKIIEEQIKKLDSESHRYWSCLRLLNALGGTYEIAFCAMCLRKQKGQIHSRRNPSSLDASRI